MKKTISIDGKEYFLQSSAYTQFAYKNHTGRSFLGDIKTLIKKAPKNKKNNNFELTELDEITTLILDLSYIMIVEADSSQVKSYEDYVKGIGNLYDDIKWIEQVIELGISPISRQLSSNK